MKGYEKGDNIPINGNNKPYPAKPAQTPNNPKLDKDKTVNTDDILGSNLVCKGKDNKMPKKY